MTAIDFEHDLLPLKNKLYRLALRITLDSLEAEDVVEDTLVKVWERREELLKIRNLEIFCLTICRNLAIDRSQQKEAQHLSYDESRTDDFIDTTDLADERIEREERFAKVRACFALLPEKQRTALQLRDIDGRSYEEVAAIMKISGSDVKVTLHRARQSLKMLLEKHSDSFRTY